MDNLEKSKHTFRANPFDPEGDGSAGKKKRRQPGFLERLFFSILSIEGKNSSNPPRKISLYKENADKVRMELENVRKELQKELNEDFSAVISEVIDPMLRKIGRINRIMKRTNREAKAEFKLQEWTKDAAVLVKLFSKPAEKEAVKLEIIKHVIQKSNEKIDRDIAFLENYLEQSLEQMNAPLELFYEAKVKKKEELAVFVGQLQSLKRRPEEADFSSIGIWKRSLDIKRAEIYNECLYLIERD